VGTFAGFLSLISAAVTPVVMISVCATLIIGIGSKHQSLADRARSLAAEYRATDRDSWRRPVVRRQVRAFLRRATLSWLAHCLIYLAAAIFSGTVLSALLALHKANWGRLTIALFVSGTSVLVMALILEFAELLMAQATLRWETSDIFSDD
jgi:hypothetical protein